MSRRGPDLLIAVERRAVASLRLAIGLDVLLVLVTLVLLAALDPRRALDSFSSNPGALLFMAGALCVLAVPPTWGVAFVVLTLAAAFGGKRGAAGSPGQARGAGPAPSAEEMRFREIWGLGAPNETKKPMAGGLSIRLVPDPAHDDTWAVAFRNDGSATLSDVKLLVFEGGIPTPGDLGSTIRRGRTLDHFGPSDESRFGPFRFVAGGEYLDLPLSACLLSEGHILLTLDVTTEDLDRLGSLPAVETPLPEATE